MKTTILKWDYYLQLLLGIIDIAVIVFAWYIPYLLLFVQLIIGLYQLFSSGIHLSLQHKSIGFAEWRTRHFFGSIIYITLLGILAKYDAYNTFLFVTLVMVIPQLILFAYIVLCKKELDFIEEREFHILK